ncbi:hypothetical protein BCY84_13675 [Trypanosoma cruzi cruzi]|nr:hypothetical protein BCY84_13675 [Trypanosoma cruzi cruzi]
MYDSCSSVDGEGGFSVPVDKKYIPARKSMRSLFAQDALQSKQGVTSLRYEEQSKKNKTVSLSVMEGNSSPGYPPNAPSPLQTAVQAVTIAYSGDTSMGACVVAVCVPHANAPIATPLIAIVDREKRPRCRVPMDGGLQFLQNESSPQYASLYDPSLGSHWTLMFKGRRECTEFFSAVHTTVHYTEVDIGAAPRFVEWNNEKNAEEGALQVKLASGDVASISYIAWLLRRMPGTRFFSIGKMVEEVPPEAPCEVLVGDGSLMAGIEEALVGMQRGASRLVFVPPKKTSIRMGMGNPEVSPSDTVVVHLTCQDVAVRSDVRGGHKATVASPLEKNFSNSGTQAKTTSPAPVTQTEPSSKPVPDAPAVVGGDLSTLLQAILLKMLQQQQNSSGSSISSSNNTNNNNNSTGCDSGNGVSGQWSALERSIDRVHIQLSSLYEKIDRLAIAETLEKNNAAIERIVKRVVGKAPAGEVDVEEMAKDRDGLLATIERLKKRLDEETNNYHRALEAMGRHKDEVHSLRNDLCIEQETHESRMRQLEEHNRLKFVEMEVRHRQAIERVAEEKLREGREIGLKEGLQLGKQEALEAAGGHSDREWKDRFFASEQRALQLEAEMQERESHHISERRGLQEQIDALHEMTEKLDQRAQHARIARQTGVEETSRQCKLLRRAMNAAYTHMEMQLSGMDETVNVTDVLQMLMVALRSETDTFIDEIKKQAEFFCGLDSQSAVPIEGEKSRVQTDENASDHLEATEAEAMDKKRTTALFPGKEQKTTMNTELAEDECVKIDELPPVPPQDLSSFMCDNPPNVFPESVEPVAEDDDISHEFVRKDENKKGDLCNVAAVTSRLPKSESNDDESDW